jgi:hypothetical protein
MSQHFVKMIDGIPIVIHNLIVHSFNIDAMEYDNIPANIFDWKPFLEWKDSEKGRWIISHCCEVPECHSHIDYELCLRHFIITAKIKESDLIYFNLKWA